MGHSARTNKKKGGRFIDTEHHHDLHSTPYEKEKRLARNLLYAALIGAAVYLIVALTFVGRAPGLAHRIHQGPRRMQPSGPVVSDSMTTEEKWELFQRGYEAQKAGRLDEAEHYYNRHLEVDPTRHSDTYNNLAVLYRDTGRYNLAHETWRRGIEVFPGNHILSRNYDAIHAVPKPGEKNSRQAGAVATGGTSGQKQPVTPADEESFRWFRRGFDAQQAGRLEDAERSYKKHIEVDPRRHSNTYNNLAVLLADQGRRDEAIDVWKTGFEIFPNDRIMLRSRGYVFSEGKGRTGGPRSWAMWTKDRAGKWALFKQALRNHETGNIRKAEELYLKHISSDPMRHSNTYCNLAILYRNAGRLDEAKAMLKKGSQAFPDDPLLRLAKNFVHSTQLTPDPALETVEGVMAALGTKPPKSSEEKFKIFRKGYEAQKIRRFHEAEQYYLEHILLDPDFHSDTYNNLALIWRDTNRQKEAIAMHDRGLDLFPGNSLLERTLNYIRNKPSSKAASTSALPKEEEDKESNIVPPPPPEKKDDNSYFRKAYEAHKKGDLVTAERYYKEHLETVHPEKHGDALNNLAVLFHNLGRHAEAIEIWWRAWNLFPGNEVLLNKYDTIHAGPKFEVWYDIAGYETGPPEEDDAPGIDIKRKETVDGAVE